MAVHRSNEVIVSDKIEVRRIDPLFVMNQGVRQDSIFSCVACVSFSIHGHERIWKNTSVLYEKLSSHQLMGSLRTDKTSKFIRRDWYAVTVDDAHRFVVLSIGVMQSLNVGRCEINSLFWCGIGSSAYFTMEMAIPTSTDFKPTPEIRVVRSERSVDVRSGNVN